MSTYNLLDHTSIESIEDVGEILTAQCCSTVLIKKLSRNNNDKNQIYFHHDASLLNSIFDLTFGTREKVQSLKGKSKHQGKTIPEAIFNDFHWISSGGKLHKVDHCKGILYLQYPEVRLSGFKANTGIMPYSLSINFTKKYPNIDRYLAIGATERGKAIALIIVNPGNQFKNDFISLPMANGSKICREFIIKKSNSDILKLALSKKISGKNVKGCRLSSDNQTLPFVGTQVHGYTLEHELGIATNASKNGDFLGIELKCFTKKKLTLFTPEPDGGLYAKSFKDFMIKYGYSKSEVYRLTGLHRVGSVCEKSELSLQVICSKKDSKEDTLVAYDHKKKFSHQMKNLQVVLKDGENLIAASWSLGNPPRN